ncbi:hypothetical protein P12x_003061 [Tundrisphaera lichenicola]|uniref:hypothetical protein n=1 Tax=Tundrisphaera lichenicola TaxID=2029860 RepID=UPI003EBF9394
MASETTTPDRPEIIRRAFKGTVDDVDSSKRTVTAIITTDAIDRYKEVILPKGIALDNYRANPVVLWCHMGTIVVAKNLWIKRFSKAGVNGLIAKTLFAKTDNAEEIFQLYVEGFLNGWSIGARPDWSTCSSPTPDEIKARPELKACYGIIRKCELLEYSAVSIPANPEALGNEIGKSISRSLREEIQTAERWSPSDPAPEPEPEPTPAPPVVLPELVGRTFEQALAETRAMVARMTGPAAVQKAAQDTIDRLKGRV